MLVDDIVDTGRTSAYAAAQLRRSWIGDLWTCALLVRPQRREIAVAIDFFGFSIGDVFVVGYGTDYAQKNRYLPYIGAPGEIQQFEVAHRSATPSVCSLATYANRSYLIVRPLSSYCIGRKQLKLIGAGHGELTIFYSLDKSDRHLAIMGQQLRS